MRGAAAALVAVAAALAVGCSSSGSDGVPVGADAVDARRLETGTAPRTGAPVPERPADVRLPSGVVVRVRAVATRPDGHLDVPDDVEVAGWWRGGARLGDPFGSTLLAGHVDSTTQGLGPYVELLGVRAGQRVRLRSAHLRQAFVVRSLRLVPANALPEHRSVYSARGPRRLTMVTCAPPYVPERGGYQNLAVVTAVPVTPVLARRRS